MRRSVADPRIVRHLLVDEGEVVVDEVRKHWVVFIVPLLLGLGGLLLMVLAMVLSLGASGTGSAVALVLLLGSIVAIGYAAWRALEAHMDRFVITNMRVFRVHGVLTKKVATTPIMRILDITVDKPFIGRILGYGHFIFESAAQEQGLRNITFVGRPDQRDLTIQRLLQRSGVRPSATQSEPEEDDESGAEVEAVPETVPRPTGRRRADHSRSSGPPSARRHSR